jgi:hypothetical protein
MLRTNHYSYTYDFFKNHIPPPLKIGADSTHFTVGAITHTPPTSIHSTQSMPWFFDLHPAYPSSREALYETTEEVFVSPKVHLFI